MYRNHMHPTTFESHPAAAAALRASTGNSRYLKAGDELVFSADWLGARSLHIERSRG